jgi:hypothetical protein
LVYAALKGVEPGDIRYEKNRIIVGDMVIPTDNDYSIYIDYYFPRITGGTGDRPELSNCSGPGFPQVYQQGGF